MFFMNTQHLLLLGTGGTIAGLAMDTQKPLNYVAGQLPVEGLLEKVQESLEFGEVRTVQVANIDSRNMT